MTWKVLISAPYLLPFIEEYRPSFEENDIEITVADVEERLEEADLLKVIGEFDGIIAGDDRFTAKVFEAAPKLKALIKWGTGIDSYDQEAAARHGVVIGRTVDAFTEPVSDTIMGLFLCFARNLPFMDRQMKAGTWKKIHGRTLGESTIGVIGIGATGSAVLRKARPFGATLIGCDIREVHPGHVRTLGVEMVSFEEVLERSDYLTVNCDLNETSHHLLNEAAFKRMKNDAVLVNAARGPIVDEQALIAALEAGEIAGAGLDVFEHEPLPAESPLRRMDNVLIAPHNSNSSRKAWDAVHRNSIRMLVNVLKTGSL
jgi:phosphoglycerate dehydrogenase-like enzyme